MQIQCKKVRERRYRAARVAVLGLGGLLLGTTSPQGAVCQDGEGLEMAYAALGMAPLPARLSAGFRGTEIRMRTSFSYAVPHTLVVLRRDSAGAWDGSAWLWSDGGDANSRRSPQVIESCDGADFLSPVICPAHPPSVIDWDYVGTLAVDSLGVFDLADPSTLPAPTVAVLDGLYLFAEMVEAGKYRSVSWVNHEVREEPQAMQAYQVHRLVDVLTRPPCRDDLSAPWVERVIRIHRRAPDGLCFH